MPWEQFIVKDRYEQDNLLYYIKTEPSIPLIAIIDEKGNVLRKIEGYDPDRDLFKEIEPFLQN
ncbi:hypothetical protein D3C87_1688890 [compost metagenome]